MAPVDPPQNTIVDIDTHDGRVVYYLCQEGGQLYEEKYDGDFGVPSDLGDAKPGTNAVYLLLGDEKRTVYCLGEDNTIKDFVFDPEEWEWVEGNLAGYAFNATPDTEFAAISRDASHREVFFQGVSGSIQSVHTTDGGETWELSDHLPETHPAAGGASLCSLEVGDKIYVFYAHQTYSVHALTFDDETWRDELVPATTLAATISSIYAKLDRSSYMLQFCDPDGNVYLASEGESVKLGKIVNGRVKVDKDAQSDRFPVQIKSHPKPKGWSS